MKKKSKTSLFEEKITPACEYCEFGTDASDYKMIQCRHSGIVSPYFRCKKFRYSPIRRKPKRLPKLPSMDPSNFSL